jgi:hypothetical protein
VDLDADIEPPSEASYLSAATPLPRRVTETSVPETPLLTFHSTRDVSYVDTLPDMIDWNGFIEEDDQGDIDLDADIEDLDDDDDDEDLDADIEDTESSEVY